MSDLIFEFLTGSSFIGGNLGGGRKSRKIPRVERSGLNLVGRISASPRYVTDTTRLDLLSLVELDLVNLEGSCGLKLLF